ncbi:HTH-10 family transcription regulator [Natrialba magadii ATCC 43099]|uniref:Bacterio-opsin activator HTH domain-containing protein n=1 Tax=Natrialba magadii (strain ATCC 43099 / DSM 3394 / CCM 3739 / CIP 104546 / IAM 13178 / JCM 8861 / NBRC 102185 / NCIMB 2190 / MS3) TaxID=547559 RepID=D3SYL9_NATMM|nr:helix-turn-helix domain-containing protein [Natrialba magadii]ADD04130.1 HTH-10 family transcription regulator [Natrialba magadii ATCC 43099]ELY32915.1 bacterio-opsin activator HTH domain-containing protein [Natrialba magadii ATCC 43099]
MRFVEVTVEGDDWGEESAAEGDNESGDSEEDETTPADTRSFDARIAAEDAIVREELLNWRMSRNDVLNQLLFVVGDRTVYEAALESAPEIVGYELKAVDDERFYAYVQEDSPDADQSWWAAFFGHDFIHVPPVVIEDGVVRLTLLGEFEALREVVDDLSATVSVEIEEIGDYRGRGPRVTDQLTARQYRALRQAVDCGYYEIPREGSLADIAAALECTESTASDLLRRAERAVMQSVLS